MDNSELYELEKFISNIKSGNISGKPLTFDFLREKKIGGKRIYFLVYEEVNIVLLVNASNKKYQQETIDEIKLFLPEFKKYVYEIYKNKT